MKGILKKSVAVLLTATMVATPITRPENAKEVKAGQLGSLANEVTGTWSYWDGNKDVVIGEVTYKEKSRKIQIYNW